LQRRGSEESRTTAKQAVFSFGLLLIIASGRRDSSRRRSCVHAFSIFRVGRKTHVLVDKIRSTTQPHLIVADRTVGGKYENILTPEQTVPEKPMNVPWESCITIGRDWAYHYDGNEYLKSVTEIIHLFIGVVAKGGNLALNVTPQPDGELPAKVLESLNELGNWLKINGEGIYGTRPIAPYSNGNICYTQKNGNIYAFLLYNKNYHTQRAAELFIDRKVKSITLLRTGENVPFTQKGNIVIADTKNLPLYNLKYADCLKIEF